jgi:hypothetical protein
MIQAAAANAEASTTPNPINFPGEDASGKVPVGDNSEGEDGDGGDGASGDGASGDGGFGGGGQGDGGFSGGGGGGSLIVPVIVDPTTEPNPK